MVFDICMHSSSSVLLLRWHDVKAFSLQPQKHGDFHVSRPALWPSYECCRLLSVLPPRTIMYYLLVISGNMVGNSSLCHLEIIEYCVLAVMPFLATACDGTVGTSVPNLALVYHAAVCLSLQQHFCELVFTTTGSVIASTVMHVNIRLLTWSFNVQPGLN